MFCVKPVDGCKGSWRKKRSVRPRVSPQRAANPAAVFDLGASDGSDIAANKDAMLAEAFASNRRQSRRRMA
jgi:hypothetical protein